MAEWKKVIVSGSIAELQNHFNGQPTLNAWQNGLDGSYFGTFTPTTYTSDILRFVAGLLSASAPAPSPNTKTFNGITENITNNSTATAPAGYVPQNSTTPVLTYLVDRGFTAVGSTLFPGKTIVNNSNYTITYSSSAGGVTSVSSSNDAQLFGLGVLTNVPFRVSGTINWFYSDNNNETLTESSQSQYLLSLSNTGSAGGLTLARINTANPLVIPPAFLDGKFTGIFSSGLYNNGRISTSVSSSGWYHISASISISSGSSAYSTQRTASERIFYAPLTNIETDINVNSLAYNGDITASLTATSRSLSGAPYLQTATWSQISTASGFFSPMYAADTTLADLHTTNTLVTLGGITAASTAGGTIQTANAVFDSTGVTARNTSTVPFETDIIKLNGSVTFNAGTAGATNIQQSSTLSSTTFTVLTRGKNRNGSQSTLNTETYSFHSPGTFNQPATSGSLAYYGRAQAYDAGTLSGTSETFFGENFRLKIDNNLLTGTYANATKWITSSYDAYSLGALDLQVKPGHLVRPGGSYGYWLTDPNPSKEYKYYARAFRRDLATAAVSMTVNVGKTLVNWNSTSAGTAVALIFASSGTSVYTPPRIYDVSNLVANLITANVSNDDFRNPFLTDIDLYGNSGGQLNGTTYLIPLRTIDGMILDNTRRDVIVLIRYKGDQVPVTSITVTYNS
jgi:hypothetical protein